MARPSLGGDLNTTCRLIVSVPPTCIAAGRKVEDHERVRLTTEREKLRATDPEGLIGAWAMIEDLWRGHSGQGATRNGALRAGERGVELRADAPSPRACDGRLLATDGEEDRPIRTTPGVSEDYGSPVLADGASARTPTRSLDQGPLRGTTDHRLGLPQAGPAAAGQTYCEGDRLGNERIGAEM